MLPPLLHAAARSPTCAQRLGPAGTARRRSRPPRRPDERAPRREDLPRGGAGRRVAPASGSSGSRATPRSATASPRSLQAWLGDPAAVAVLEPRTSLAYERSELVPDETAARVAALAAWQSGRARVLVASVQALLQHTIDPADLPEQPWLLRPGARIGPEQLLRRLFALGYVPVFEVAGRGEFARRGGIVDVFPPTSAFPVRIEFFGDEIDSIRSFDPADQRTIGRRSDVDLLPASEFLLPAGGVAEHPRTTQAARHARRTADGRPRTVRDPGGGGPARGAAGATRRGRAGRSTSATRPRSGRASSPRPPASITSAPTTLLVLDEPGDIAEAAEFLWRQADERRAELIEAGDLPKSWPSTYLEPRAWKGRLVASRTLELTWESEAAGAMAAAA